MPQKGRATIAVRRRQAQATNKAMIDNFALGLSHLLMMIAAIILLRRPALDHEGPAPDDSRKDDPKDRRRA